MKSSFFPVVLATLPAVSAWRAYLTDFADPYGGGGIGEGLQLFNDEPNCDDVGNGRRPFAATGNAWQDGWYCDGCASNKHVDDMEITKIEFLATGDRRVIQEDLGGLLFAEPQDDNPEKYDMWLYKADTDSSEYAGYCDRIYHGHDFFCSWVLTSASGIHTFDCYGTEMDINPRPLSD